MRDVAPFFINEYTEKFEEKYRPRTLAEFVLQLKLAWEEPQCRPRTLPQKMAYRAIEHKPKDMKFHPFLAHFGN